MAAGHNFASASRRPRPATLAAIILLHLLAIYALARAFAPQAVTSVEDAVLSSITVTVETKQYEPPPEPEPEPEPEPDPGAAAPEGRRAVPRAVAAPEPKVVIKPAPPAPKVSSTGPADSSAARDAGSGTGAGGTGAGTGSGTGGSGQGGGGIASPPVHIGGAINNARDYPVPPGGRGARVGSEVVVRVTVTPAGRATDCSIYRPSPDPQADAITCRLVVERLRFRPAMDAAGNPVAAPFLWRQRWF
ncbi:MAG: TonB family protein [Cypionkella sp.]